MSTATMANLDPVTTSDQIHRHFKAILKAIEKGELLGPVTHMVYRLEYQQRVCLCFFFNHLPLFAGLSAHPHDALGQRWAGNWQNRSKRHHRVLRPLCHMRTAKRHSCTNVAQGRRPVPDAQMWIILLAMDSEPQNNGSHTLLSPRIHWWKGGVSQL